MAPLALDSTETALCLIPPKHLLPALNRLRKTYDPDYGIWPPHLNIIYPFVPILEVDRAVSWIASNLGLASSFDHSINSMHVSLSSSGIFTHEDGSSTLYLAEEFQVTETDLSRLRKYLLSLFDSKSDQPTKLHMTIGKAGAGSKSEFLLQKLGSLPLVSWKDTKLAVLVREPKLLGIGEGWYDEMKRWGQIDLVTGAVTRHHEPLTVCEPTNVMGEPNVRPALQFSSQTGRWSPLLEDSPQWNEEVMVDHLVVASYNVLADLHWPPDRQRHSRLVANLLRDNSRADILILQEVTDNFLPMLLGDSTIRTLYPFTTHGPPDRDDIEPLSSMVSIVVLSRFRFRWRLLPLKRRHKSSPILEFPGIGIRKRGIQNELLPLVVVGCHLTHGLTDGAVAAIKDDFDTINRYLETNYPKSPCILAGDFNLATSSYTIRMAHENGSITPGSYRTLDTFEALLSTTGFYDAWAVARCAVGESSSVVDSNRLLHMFEGEQGATFNPIDNPLITKQAGSGVYNRPQRYDRILVGSEGPFEIRGFNVFGLPTQTSTGDVESPASDHWGVRCLLEKRSVEKQNNEGGTDWVFMRASSILDDNEIIRECLRQWGFWPNDEDKAVRDTAVRLIRNVLLNDTVQTADKVSGYGGDQHPGSKTIVVPVGSFGMGLWTVHSDVDCLCMGPFSSETFFDIATIKLRKAKARGVNVLRKVKTNTGTMLELEILGIKIDLQYCQSRYIAEKWPEVMKLPASDPVFSLSQQTLLKLKAARDMEYLLRSMPDQVQFRTAYLLLKAWARGRGIYAAKFGYLGGISLAVLLVRVCKLVTLQAGTTRSTGSIIATFFHQYAEVNWKVDKIYDPYFYKAVKYSRNYREPLCILGWHGPYLNTTLASSGSTMTTIAAEMSRANSMLSQRAMTWEKFIGADAMRQGSVEFLNSYKRYVSLNVNYWGLSAHNGRMFVGWLESRFVTILADIDKSIRNLFARFWPASFYSASDEEDGKQPGFRKCYLIGIEWDQIKEESTKERTEDEDVASETNLYALLNHFSESIRAADKYYNAKTCYFGVSIVSVSQVRDLALHNESLWDCEVGEDESDYEGDEDTVGEEAPPLPIIASSQSEDGEVAVSAENNDTETLESKSSLFSSAVPRPEGSGRLRPASHVLNRIRWDVNLDEGSFVVGYEDRFEGAQEKLLSQWKSEQTDEEFIPQHRILYFKRTSDGVVVWDRRKKLDLLFGSGAKPPTG